jgi:type II restriction/modification system DNA methylase subunit YeeA
VTPQEFIAKWHAVELKERSASQAHFIDLCRLLGVKDPISDDPKGEFFAFEKGASKTSGGEGWADVWRKNCFAWEYKGKAKDLDKAFAQLQQYAIALENPPLLIVSDMDRIRIHTNWTNTVQQVHHITLEDLLDAGKRDLLRACFTDPEKLKPSKTRQLLTEEAAQRFATLAQRLRNRGHAPDAVAHFVNRLIFCMFAEDVGLLPDKLFEQMLDASRIDPAEFEPNSRILFEAMRKGGRIDFKKIEWFNGGLFDTDGTLPLEKADILDLIEASKLDWSDIDPSILGTLFERGLDPDKRSQLGAHYTDRDKIMMIVRPVIVEPLLAEWATVKTQIEAELAKAAGTTGATKTKATNEANRLRIAFMERLTAFRVLDPACGSGNFLYLALLELKNLEHRVNLECEALGLPREFPRIGPEAVLGIELNPYAAELARVSVWIGEIQWMRRNGFEAARDPILRKLDTIENRDAVLAPDGTRAEWPKADVVVGNPPFLGSKFLRNGKPATRTRPAVPGLGDTYVNKLFAAYEGENPASSDLVTYWFVQCRKYIRQGDLDRVGLVATKSVAKGASNFAIASIVNKKSARIFFAVSNTDWVVDGADVRVSLVCMDRTNSDQPAILDGLRVASINPDLSTGTNLTVAAPLAENAKCSFQGVKQNGTFEILPEKARQMLAMPTNPNGQPNSRVIKKFCGNDDVSMRDQDGWIVDFTDFKDLDSASLFEAPFESIRHVEQERTRRTKGETTEVGKLAEFWLMQRPRQELRSAIVGLHRVLAVPETSEHFIFRWLPSSAVFSGSLFVFSRSDNFFFGICQSRIHTLWARAIGNNLGAGNQDRYNKTSSFETFPFPEGLTPNIPADEYASDPRAQKIAAAAARLNELRENWLNPADLVIRVPEVVPGYPDRLLPKDEAAAKTLKTRTLTNLYNQRPTWLENAHKALDEAVAEAYGWGDDWRAGLLTDDEILARLFALNQERAGT